MFKFLGKQKGQLEVRAPSTAMSGQTLPVEVVLNAQDDLSPVLKGANNVYSGSYARVLA